MFFMWSLCGVGVRVHVSDFSSKTTRPRDMLFFLKIAYLSRMTKCSRHAAIATLRFSLFSKSVVTSKLLHLQFFLSVCHSPGFVLAITLL